MPKQTPWGDADYETTLIPRAVTWVTTPTHGGMMISKVWAQRNLSPAALDEALVHGSYYCFEEDLAWVIPSKDNEEIFNKIILITPGRWTVQSLNIHLDIMLQHFPNYVAKTAGTYTGVTPKQIVRGTTITTVEGSVYTVLNNYKGKDHEWLVNKVRSEADVWGCRSGVYRLSWSAMENEIRRGGNIKLPTPMEV